MINKEKILHHIRNTRTWLDKAQALAEKNNVLRAIMALFLAAAEIRIPLKESMEKSQPRMVKKSKIKDFLPVATIAASILLIIGVAGYIYTISFQTPVVTKIEEKSMPVKVKVEKVKVEKPSISQEKEIERKPQVLVTAKKSKAKKKVRKITKRSQKVYNMAKTEKWGGQPKVKKEEKKVVKMQPLSKKALKEIEVLELVNVAEKALKGKTD